MKKLIELIKANSHPEVIKKKAIELRGSGLISKSILELILAFTK